TNVPSNFKTAGASAETWLAATLPPWMSSTNDVLRSKHVRTIFEVTADAFFAHSRSAFRRLASSSKKDFVKYWTMYRSLEAEEASAEKPSRSRGGRARAGKV